MLNNIIAVIVISFLTVGLLWGIGNLLNPKESDTVNTSGLLLVAENNLFNQTNPDIFVNVNHPQKITIVNQDFVKHDFIVDELKINTAYLSSGQDFVTAIASSDVGTFEYYCSLHPSTMRGKIIVSDN